MSKKSLEKPWHGIKEKVQPTVVHNGLIRLMLEIAVPPAPELFARPAVHHVQLLFRRPYLDTCLDTVCCKRAGAVDIPLLEDSFLYFGVTPHEVVEGLDVWFGSEDREGEIVVLEVQTNTREVDKRLDTSFSELLGVTFTYMLGSASLQLGKLLLTNTRALKNERRGKRAPRHNNLLASPDNLGLQLTGS
jgi:hypothetical protein